MPKREDERWAGQQSELRYCYKHKRYFRADAGCQPCGDEEAGRRSTSSDRKDQRNTEHNELIRCKHCNQQFSPSDYETHLKLLARSARRGAVCLIMWRTHLLSQSRRSLGMPEPRVHSYHRRKCSYSRQPRQYPQDRAARSCSS